MNFLKIILFLNFSIIKYSFEINIKKCFTNNTCNLIKEPLNNLKIIKRIPDTTFYGKPKTKAVKLAQKFNMTSNIFAQSVPLIKLINYITSKYLVDCPPVVLYDQEIANANDALLEDIFKTFPISFLHGLITKEYKLKNLELLDAYKKKCYSFILFLSDPLMTREIIGPQTISKVVLIAKSSQWKVQDFLASEESSNIVNLLVIKESLTTFTNNERPYVLYTHKLFSDGLGSNIPIVLASYINGGLSHRNVNLFPTKFTEGFSGHRFIVAAVNQPPFIFRIRSIDSSGIERIDWEGIEYRLLHKLAKGLNFTFEIIQPRNVDTLGSGDAVTQEVQFGRADIAMAGVYITQERLDIVEMSTGHSSDCAAFITLASKALPKHRAIMGPFQWPVWIALTAIYLLAIFPLVFSDRLSFKHLIRNAGEVENMFWYVFGTFTNSLTFSGEYSWNKSEKFSTRLLIGFYWIFTIIISACYTGSIIAFVTLPSFPATVDSVDDLLGLFFRVGTLDRGGWERWFVNSTHKATAKIYKKMEYVTSFDEGIGNVTNAFFWNYAFLGSKAQLQYLIQSNFTDDSLSKRTALHLSEECFVNFQVAFSFPKNSVFSKKINDLIMRFHQTGLITKILNEVSWKMQRSSSGKLLQAGSGTSLKITTREDRQLTLADTEGMFLLLGIGFLIAVMALISEIVGGFSNKCRQIIKNTIRPETALTSLTSDSNSEKDNINENKKNYNKPIHRVDGWRSLSLTKETIKGLFEGHRKRDPNFIIQNSQLILETEAISTDSSFTDRHNISDCSVELHTFQSNDVEINNKKLRSNSFSCGNSNYMEKIVEMYENEQNWRTRVIHSADSCFGEPIYSTPGPRKLYPLED